ncbi:CAP domain-containing protein [Clostridium tertium]|uniref:Cysteine-rich secretory protein family protein n=1 Tax=Clostridium tertium TaxID=1559 RepID=A0A6N3FWE3_9CLOT
MSKSKVVTIIVSLGVIVALGVGAYFMYSNKQTPDDIAKVEEKDKTPSDKEAKENKDNNPNTPNNNDKQPNASHENNGGGTAENNNPANNNDNAQPSNPPENPSVTPAPPKTEERNNGGNPGNSNKPSVPSDSNFATEIEQLIFERVNSERKAAGLSELSYNTTMEKYARIKSADMGDKGYFSHQDPQGKLITDNMKADGVSYNAWGENIAYIQGRSGSDSLAKEFMDNWMNSSGHRANILSTNFTSIGVGVYKIGSTYYATQEFYR